MKKQITFYDAILLMFVYFNLTKTGKVISLWELGFIYALVVIVDAFATALLDSFGITDRIKFYFWKIALNYRKNKAAKKAKQEIETEFQNAKNKAHGL